MSPMFTENPEAAMVHAKPQRLAVTLGGCLTLVDDDRADMQPPPRPTGKEHPPSAAFFDLPPLVTITKPEAGTVPGFDSEAHRAFMRGLE